MALLEAILAFSVSMLVLSTMSLAIVEVMHRTNKVRERYFEQIVEHMFEQFVWPQIARLTDMQNLDQKELRNDFINAMISVTGLVKLDVEQSPHADHEKKASPLKFKRTERLNSVEFAQRIAQTQAGQLLMEKSEDFVKTFIVDLTRNLESISSGSSSAFRVHSQRFSMISAFIIAILFNVDAIHMFRSYVHDPQLVQSIVALGPQAEQAYNEQQQKLKELKERFPEAIENGTDPDSEGSEDKKVSPEQQAEALQAELDALMKLAETNYQASQQTAQDMQEAGMPIGEAQFPLCARIDNKSDATAKPLYADNRCAADFWDLWESKYAPVNAAFSVFERLLSLHGIAWILGIGLAGILIGLGSPFWFQVYQKLSSALRIFRGLRGITGGQQTPAEPVKEDKTTPTPERAAQVFVDAMRVKTEHTQLAGNNALRQVQESKIALNIN